MGKTHFPVFWSIAVAGLIVISLIPSLRPPPDYHVDLALHWAGFMALALVAVAWAGRLRWAVGLCLLLAAVGLGIEMVQSFLPDREASVWDFAANCVGIVAGFLAGLPVMRHRGHRAP